VAEREKAVVTAFQELDSLVKKSLPVAEDALKRELLKEKVPPSAFLSIKTNELCIIASDLAVCGCVQRSV
jgi:hypothetical protein